MLRHEWLYLGVKDISACCLGRLVRTINIIVKAAIQYQMSTQRTLCHLFLDRSNLVGVCGTKVCFWIRAISFFEHKQFLEGQHPQTIPPSSKCAAYNMSSVRRRLTKSLPSNPLRLSNSRAHITIQTAITTREVPETRASWTTRSKPH